MANVCRAMVAGAIAGCAASWLMTKFSPGHEMRSQAQPPSRAEETDEKRRRTGKHQHRLDKQRLVAEDRGVVVEEPTVTAAEAISRRYFEHDLTEGEKRIVGPAVHYAYGSLVGAMYGGLAELLPSVSMGMGLPFGATLWLLGDEIAVPALGLGKGPTEIPAEKHADSLAGHFAYGATTDLLRRVLRHIV